MYEYHEVLKKAQENGITSLSNEELEALFKHYLAAQALAAQLVIENECLDSIIKVQIKTLADITASAASKVNIFNMRNRIFKAAKHAETKTEELLVAAREKLRPLMPEAFPVDGAEPAATEPVAAEPAATEPVTATEPAQL